MIQITKLFDTLDVTDDRDRLKLSIHCLTHTAYGWWLEETRLRPVHNFTWDGFIHEFYEKFFPRPKKEKLMDKFLDLEQKNLSVDEYRDEFDRLAKYAPGIVLTEASRAWKFVRGLRPDTKKRMSGKEWTSLRKAYEAALR